MIKRNGNCSITCGSQTFMQVTNLAFAELSSALQVMPEADPHGRRIQYWNPPRPNGWAGRAESNVIELRRSGNLLGFHYRA